MLAVSEEEVEGFGEDCHPSVESTKGTSDLWLWHHLYGLWPPHPNYSLEEYRTLCF